MTAPVAVGRDLAVACDAPDQRTAMGRLHRRGTVVRDGRAVGFWRVWRVRTTVSRGVVAHRRVDANGLAVAADGRLVGVSLRYVDPDRLVGRLQAALDADDGWSPDLAAARLRNLLDRFRTGAFRGVARMLEEVTPPELGSSTREAVAEAGATRDAEEVDLRAFLASLDPDAVAWIGGLDVGVTPLRDLGHAWPWVDARVTPGAPLRAALSRHPHASRLLVAECLRDPVAFARDAAGGSDRPALMRACVARGIPRSWALAAVDLGAALRRGDDGRLRSVSGMFAVPDDDGTDHVEAVLRLLAPLPPGWIPRTPEAWDALLDALPAIDLAVNAWPRDVLDPVAFLGCGGRWGRFVEDLARACGAVSLADALPDLLDAALAFSEQVVEPALATSGTDLPRRGAATTASLRLLAGSGTVVRLLDLSRRWHARRPAPRQGLGTLAGWSPGLPDHVDGGVSMVVLLTPRAMEDEGAHGCDADGVAGLGHCVGAYASRCRQGASRVASVRTVDANGRITRLSTAEFDVTRVPPRLVQHRSRGNAPPPPEADAAMARYVKGLASGRLEVDASAFVPVDEPDADLLRAGYDWRVEGAWEAMRDAWRHLLPRALRGAPPEAFAGAWKAVHDRMGSLVDGGTEG